MGYGSIEGIPYTPKLLMHEYNHIYKLSIFIYITLAAFAAKKRLSLQFQMETLLLF